MKPVPASARDLRMPALPAARVKMQSNGFMKFNKKEMISYV